MPFSPLEPPSPVPAPPKQDASGPRPSLASAVQDTSTLELGEAFPRLAVRRAWRHFHLSRLLRTTLLLLTGTVTLSLIFSLALLENLTDGISPASKEVLARAFLVSHLVLWLSGALMVGLGALRSSMRWQQKAAAEHALRARESLLRSLIGYARDAVAVVRGEQLLYTNPAFESLFGPKAHPHHSDGLSTFLEPALCQAIETLQCAPGGPTQSILLEGAGTGVSGAPLALEIQVTGLTSRENEILLIIRDVSELRQATQQRERRERQQRALARLGQDALARLPLDQLFQQCAALLCDTLDLPAAYVWEILPEADQLLLRAEVGLPEGMARTLRAALEDSSHAGYVLRRGRPVVVADLAQETRFEACPILLERGLRSGVCLRLGPEGQPFGLLGVSDTARREFKPEEVAFLGSVANVLAAAIAQQRAEDSLKGQREKLTEILRFGRLGAFRFDFRQGRVTLSTELLRLFGEPDPPEEGLELGAAEASARYVLGDDLARLEQLVAQLLQDSSRNEEEGRIRILGVAKTPITLQIRLRAVRGAQGEPVALEGTCLDVTAQELSYQALQASEAQYRSLVELSPDALALTTLDGTITFCNQQLAVMQGVPSPDIFLGTNASAWTSEEARPAMQEAVARVIQHGSIRRERTTVLRVDGSRFAAEVNATLLRDEAGQPSRLMVILRDVSAQVLYEAELRDAHEKLEQRVRRRTLELERSSLALERSYQALQESEERFRSLVERSRDGIFLIDADGQVIAWNQAMEAITGLPRDRIVGLFAWEVETLLTQNLRNPDLVRERVMEALQGRGGQAHGIMDWQVVTPAGTKRMCEAVVFVVQGERGGRLGCVLRDVTAAREARAAIQQSQQRLWLLVQSSPVGVIEWSASHTVQAWNPAAEVIFQHSREEVVGTPALALFGTSALPILTMLQNAAVQRSRVTCTSSHPMADGTLRICEWISAPLFSEQGDILGLVSIVQDITERQRMEDASRRASQEALEANRAKTTFLATMSHEVRTPMTAIMGMANLLLETGLTPGQADLIHRMQASCDQLMHFVNNVMDYAKIEAGVVKVEREPFLLDEAVEGALKDVRLPADERRLELLYAREPGIPSLLEGDRRRVARVLSSLLSNAVRFTQEGEVRLLVRCSEKTPQQCRVTFAVQDTGIGISPEQKLRLFEPFYQADAGTTRRYEGSGLGLAIARRLVESMGGTIGVESALSGGTTVHFSLPFVPVRPDSRLTLEWQLRTLAGRILLMAPRAEVREYLAASLTEAGLEVHLPATAPDALAMCRSWLQEPWRPTVTILDEAVAAASCRPLARGLRQLTDEAHLPILLLARASVGGPQRREDVNGLYSVSLPRPTTPTQLLSELRRFLTTSQEVESLETSREAEGLEPESVPPRSAVPSSSTRPAPTYVFAELTDWEGVQSRWGRLRPMLLEGDLDAVPLLEQLLSRLGPVLQTSTQLRLREFIRSYDFAAILAILDGVMDGLPFSIR